MDSQNETNKNSQAVTPYDPQQKQIQAYQTSDETQLFLNQANFERERIIDSMKQMDDTISEYNKKTKELEEKKQWFVNELKRLEDDTQMKIDKQQKKIEQIEVLRKTSFFMQNHIQKLLEEKERFLNDKQLQSQKHQQFLHQQNKRYEERKRIFESMGDWSKYRELEHEYKLNQEKLNKKLAKINQSKENLLVAMEKNSLLWDDFKNKCVEIAEIFIKNQKTFKIIETNYNECKSIDEKIKKIQLNQTKKSNYMLPVLPKMIYNELSEYQPFETPKMSHFSDTLQLLNDLPSFPKLTRNTQIKSLGVKTAKLNTLFDLPSMITQLNSLNQNSKQTNEENLSQVTQLTQVTASQQTFKTPVINSSLQPIEAFDFGTLQLNKNSSPTTTVSNSKITVIKATTHKIPMETNERPQLQQIDFPHAVESSFISFNNKSDITKKLAFDFNSNFNRAEPLFSQPFTINRQSLGTGSLSDKSNVLSDSFQFDCTQNVNSNSKNQFMPLLNFEPDSSKNDKKDSSNQFPGYQFNFFD